PPWSSSSPLRLWGLAKAMHWPWFLKLGLVKLFQPPFLHWSLLVGGPVVGGGVADAGSKSYVVLLPLTPIVSLSALPTKFVHAVPPQPAPRMTPPPPTLMIVAVGCEAT